MNTKIITTTTITKIEEPQACPFCGSEATGDSDYNFGWCKCSNINCCLTDPKRPNKLSANKAWNKLVKK